MPAPEEYRGVDGRLKKKKKRETERERKEVLLWVSEGKKIRLGK